VWPTASLSTPAVEDHFDVPVVAKPLQQVLVQAGFVARNEKQVSGHGLAYCLPTLSMAGHFFLAKSRPEHLECHSTRP